MTAAPPSHLKFGLERQPGLHPDIKLQQGQNQQTEDCMMKDAFLQHHLGCLMHNMGKSPHHEMHQLSQSMPDQQK